MKAISKLVLVIALLFAGCGDKRADEHSHEHRADGLEPLAYTLYTGKTELFVEFKPLVVGKRSNFAAHLTLLGENFLPFREGKVTVSLIIGENGIRNSADSANAPGIFSLALTPTKAGTGKLLFDIVTRDYTDQILIENITVYPDEAAAVADQVESGGADDITYLKDQAWKVEFASIPVLKSVFSDVIKTSGQILSAPGDEMVVSANSRGIVQFSGKRMIAGMAVSQGMHLFTVSGANMTEGNLEVAYLEAKANFEKAKANYERASELVKDHIVSQKDYLQAKFEFENAQTAFNALGKNYSAKGQNILSPLTGFVKNLMVSEGQFVEAGAPLAVISQNKNLILEAKVSQSHFAKLSTISSANFKTPGSETVFNTQNLNGKILSYGRNASADSPYLPVTFQIDNTGNIIPGTFAEVYLKSSPVPDALVVPVSSLLEEQGNFYVYVQTGGESFQKREVKLGASDGIGVQLLSGVQEGERVVSKGAYQIKLSSASGSLPAHGHEH